GNGMIKMVACLHGIIAAKVDSLAHFTERIMNAASTLTDNMRQQLGPLFFQQLGRLLQQGSAMVDVAAGPFGCSAICSNKRFLSRVAIGKRHLTHDIIVVSGIENTLHVSCKD